MANQNDDPIRPTQDKRGFFMLLRSPMGSGYYTYGKFNGAPDRGAFQYPHPSMMQASDSGLTLHTTKMPLPD